MVNDKNITSYGSLLETFSHYVKVTIAPMLTTACVGIIGKNRSEGGGIGAMARVWRALTRCL
jgi:hypothetical protein